MIVNFMFFLVEVTLAVMLWHRAAPAMRSIAQWRAWMIFFLGLALAMLGVGQFEAAMLGTPIPFLRLTGDLALIIYGIWRFLHIVRHTPPPHWSEEP